MMLSFLDLMLPKMDGLSIIKNMRETGNDTPVIMLTAKVKLWTKLKGWTAAPTTILQNPLTPMNYWLEYEPWEEERAKLQLPQG